MKRSPTRLRIAIAAAAMFVASAGAHAETVTLKLKRLEPADPSRALAPADTIYRINISSCNWAANG